MCQIRLHSSQSTASFAIMKTKIPVMCQAGDQQLSDKEPLNLQFALKKKNTGIIPATSTY